MPEGPEILFFSTFLKKKIISTKISNIKSNTDELINIPLDLYGIVVEVCSKGKLLWIKMTSSIVNKYYYMHIHMGISGWILFKDPKYFVKYEFQLTTCNKTEIMIYLEDKVKLSKLQIYDEYEHNVLLKKMGIEIFSNEFTLEKFKNIIKKKNMMLASFMLKQEFFCGIGNYIKNEVLYMGNLDINIKTGELKDEQITELYKNILFVSYSCLIEQLRNLDMEEYLALEYKTNMPEYIEIPYKYKIYKRITTDDGKKVKKVKVGGRDTYTI